MVQYHERIKALATVEIDNKDRHGISKLSSRSRGTMTITSRKNVSGKLLSLLSAVVLMLQLSLICNAFQTRKGSIRVGKPREYANLPSVEEDTAPVVPPSFQQRMLLRVKQEDLRKNGKVSSSSSSHHFIKPTLAQEVQTLDEFKSVLEENHPYTVAVWYSPWCRACRSVAPGVAALAKHHPNMKFIQIPVLEENLALHQGLDVPSVPFVHLYLSESQLAEESKLNKKRLPAIHKMFQDYESGSCSLERLGDWSASCSYSFPSGATVQPETNTATTTTLLP